LPYPNRLRTGMGSVNANSMNPIYYVTFPHPTNLTLSQKGEAKGEEEVF